MRVASEAERQLRAASVACATAASTSAREARSASAVWTPVAGLKTGLVRPDSPGVSAPLVQCVMRAVMESKVSTAHV